MTSHKNSNLPQSIAAMVGALAMSMLVLGVTTASGPIAFTVAAAPIA